MFDFDIMHIIAGLPGLLIAMVIHEYAHGKFAVHRVLARQGNHSGGVCFA